MATIILVAFYIQYAYLAPVLTNHNNVDIWIINCT